MRRQFFRSDANPQELADRATSLSNSDRWAAAVELGEVPEEWAIKLLWVLKDDSDQYVRQAASASLVVFDHSLIESALDGLSSAGYLATKVSEGSVRPDGLAEHVAWKTRPLDAPSEANEWASTAAIIDMVNTEGPLTGARLLRLYGQSVFPNSPRKISSARVEKAVKSTMRRGVVSKSFSDQEDRFESWILHRTGTPGVSVRTRGTRKLVEIPVTEVRELLALRGGPGRRRPTSNRSFAILMEAYEIPRSEFHLVGAALEKEWIPLLEGN